MPATHEDPDRNDKPPVFTIGITLAGTVAAGSYSAGVLDYLFRAMDGHNRRVDRGDVGDPKHYVAVKVMSGASGGAVCTALAVASLINRQKLGQPHLQKAIEVPGAAVPYRYTLKTLHDVWVDQVDVWLQGKQDGLLSLSDLEGEGPKPQSLLNSKYLSSVAENALTSIIWGSVANPGKPYSFLSNELETFLTTTDLVGVPYEVKFRRGNTLLPEVSGHRMMRHGVVRHFRLTGLGTYTFKSHWLEAWKDDGMPLGLPSPGGRLPVGKGGEWRPLLEGSLASSAFPVGFAPVDVSSQLSDFGVGEGRRNGGALPIEVDPGAYSFAQPDFEEPLPLLVTHASVDGGAISNAPFGLARFTLRSENPDEEHGEYLLPNPRDKSKADRAVIMIDPFGGEKPNAQGGEGPPIPPTLSETILGLFSALIDESRFSPDELLYASDTDIYSRFLIAPSRANGRIQGQAALATAGIHSFGGFLERKFRVFDFMLGQKNCKSFIENYFKLPDNNKVLDLHGTGKNSVQIIDPGEIDPTLNMDIRLPGWPSISKDRLATILKRVESRTKAVVRFYIPGFLFLLRPFIFGYLYSLVRKSIIKSLRSRNQLPDD